MHPDGLATRSNDEDLNISFTPSPDYGGIAKAATGHHFQGSQGELYARKASTMDELREALREAVQAVNEKRGAVVEAVLAKE